MEAEQFEIMERVEEYHWWYCGLRDLIERCLTQDDLQLPPRPAVLDVGCGTGGNLKFLHGLLQPGYLGGFDSSERAIAAASRKCPAADVYTSDVRCPELRHGTFHLILSCDVLYMSGMTASLPGMQRVARALQPGGLCLIHLPAYRWLYSAHDRAVHTQERYVLGQLRQLLDQLDLQCVRASYRLCGLLPLVVLKRLPSILRPQREIIVSDLQPPAPWLNRLLLRSLQWENRIIASGGSLPWGSSIFAIGRRKPTVRS